ncbi:RraA family protein [Gordonia sp. 'Campus']|uniref:RraA family protein n=1 Tax=Gordonia sp. 'Campus' TaxID=2915824 RepID=UPI001EE3B7DD|nr:RraA family protein [Gordonia sp. 'Campus']
MRTTTDRALIRSRFLAVDVANVADVLDDLGHRDQALGTDFTCVAGRERLAGWAFTISGAMSDEPGRDPLKAQACNEIGPDEVSVWEGNGRGVCYFGELVAIGMMQRGSPGAVLDGGVRDRKWLHEIGFTTFSRYPTSVQTSGRWRVSAWQQSVTLPGASGQPVVIEPGDFILGDDDGVIVIPAALVDVVLEAAETMTDKEIDVRAAIRNGMTLADAMTEFGRI